MCVGSLFFRWLIPQNVYYIKIGSVLSDDDSESVSREASPSLESPRPVSQGSESPLDNIHASVMTSAMMSSTCSGSMRQDSKVCSVLCKTHSTVCYMYITEEQKSYIIIMKTNPFSTLIQQSSMPICIYRCISYIFVCVLCGECFGIHVSLTQ